MLMFSVRFCMSMCLVLYLSPPTYMYTHTFTQRHTHKRTNTHLIILVQVVHWLWFSELWDKFFLHKFQIDVNAIECLVIYTDSIDNTILLQDKGREITKQWLPKYSVTIRIRKKSEGNREKWYKRKWKVFKNTDKWA